MGENQFPHLPTNGLGNLRNLKTFHNRYLQDFPPPEAFPKINGLTLSYAYHCCEFMAQADEVCILANFGVMFEGPYLQKSKSILCLFDLFCVYVFVELHTSNDLDCNLQKAT